MTQGTATPLKIKYRASFMMCKRITAGYNTSASGWRLATLGGDGCAAFEAYPISLRHLLLYLIPVAMECLILECAQV